MSYWKPSNESTVSSCSTCSSLIRMLNSIRPKISCFSHFPVLALLTSRHLKPGMVFYPKLHSSFPIDDDIFQLCLLSSVLLTTFDSFEKFPLFSNGLTVFARKLDIHFWQEHYIAGPSTNSKSSGSPTFEIFYNVFDEVKYLCSYWGLSKILNFVFQRVRATTEYCPFVSKILRILYFIALYGILHEPNH